MTLTRPAITAGHLPQAVRDRGADLWTEAQTVVAAYPQLEGFVQALLNWEAALVDAEGGTGTGVPGTVAP